MNVKLLIGYCLCFSLLSSLVSAKILFDSTRGTTFIQGKDHDFSIYMMDDDGSNVRKLTDTPFLEITPRWSPDGKTIAFARDVDIALTTRRQTDLFIKDVKGTYEIRLTDHPKQDGGDLAWSPDGEQIAFVSLRSGHIDIHVIDVASRAVKQLTNNAVLGGLSAAPDWSPDGKHIAYQQLIPGQGRTIYTMEANGRNQKPLVPADGLSRGAPRWSPDGDAILYRETEYRIINERPQKFSKRLVIYQFYTKEIQKIITLPKEYDFSSMCWISPGHEIVLSAKNTLTNKIDLYRYHIGSKQLTNLTEGPGGGSSPDWIDDAALVVMPAGKLTLQWAQLKRKRDE